jgi:PAS domain S-box-containing protein
MTLLVVSAVAVLTFYDIQQEQRVFRTELQQQAILMLDTLEAASADYLYHLDSDALADIMEALGEYSEIVVSGRIYDADGWVVADAYQEDLAYSLEVDPFGEKLVLQDETIFEWQHRQLIAGRAVKVGTQRLGAISVGLPTGRFEEKIASVRRQGIWASVFAVIGGLCVALLVSYFITTPLQSLAKATNTIAHGDLSHAIPPLRGNDELALLGQAMEHMRAELYGLYQNLEQQVAERTQELQRSEARFRHVITSISDVIYMAEITPDDQWIYHYISPNIEALTGYSTQQFSDDPDLWSSCIYPVDLPRTAAQRNRLRHVVHDREEYRIIRADGQVVWVRDNVRIEQGHGKVFIYGVLSDIAAWKQVEETLRRLEKAVETTEAGITITDTEGCILYVNPADAEMHGYTVEELGGKPASIFAPPNTPGEITAEGPSQETSLWKRERLNIRKNGSTFPVKLISNLITNAQNEQIGKVVVCEDITERKDAEAKLLEAHKELQKKNAQLAELNISKDKFFSIISHDMRSSFTSLLGYTQLLEMNTPIYSREKVFSFIKKLRLSAEQLYALLENLLTWSRVQRGAMKYAPERIRLDEIVYDVAALLSPQANQKSIALENTVPLKTYIYADKDMIKTVVRNVLSNALKFTPSGGRIELSSQKHDAEMVELTVSDTGIGIKEEDLPKLFRIDVQHTHPGTAGELGTGLGLNLCKDLVKKNRGSIAVESEVGVGTIFRCTFPTAESTELS